MMKFFKILLAWVSFGILLGGCSTIHGLRMPESTSITGDDLPTLIKKGVS